MAAPVTISLDDIEVGFGDSGAVMPITIFASPDTPVDTAAFELAAQAVVAVTDVDIYPPANWFPTVILPKFGATDFGYPANPIVSEYHFADLHIAFPGDHFRPGVEERIGFSFTELGGPAGEKYEVNLTGGNIHCPTVPIPGAVWLLGAGLIGLAGYSRKKRQ